VLIFPPTLLDLSNTNFSVIPSHVWYKIIYVIIGVTFFTYLLTMYGLKYLSPTVSSSYIYFQPILVMAFAYLFLNMGIAEDYTQTITWEKTGYMLSIFLAVYLTSQGTILKRA
ncbi:MAG: EamA family transporter, partial [Flavobacteriia bacterium]